VSDDDPIPALVIQAQRGELGAFDALARRHLRVAYTLALAIVGNPSDAEDAAQDALVRALERIDTCRNPAAFRAWLLQIVRHQCHTLGRRKRLAPKPTGDGELEAGDPTGLAPDAHTMQRPLLASLRRLAEHEREVVLLHDLEGWTHAEIASALEISVVTSRQRLFQARRKLRESLGHPPARKR
jgi:RNA polymerase sigma-70 factor (ECF subfamily)